MFAHSLTKSCVVGLLGEEDTTTLADRLELTSTRIHDELDAAIVSAPIC